MTNVKSRSEPVTQKQLYTLLASTVGVCGVIVITFFTITDSKINDHVGQEKHRGSPNIREFHRLQQTVDRVDSNVTEILRWNLRGKKKDQVKDKIVRNDNRVPK